MNLSRIFIERPVATTVLVVAGALFGWLAFNRLPINDLPNVDFPTIRVTARLPGANPETMATAVATPLERQFSTIAGIDSMSSTNRAGETRIVIQFDLDRDIDAAAQDIQTAIAQAMRRLPGDIEPPALRKVNPAEFTILILGVSAKTLPLSQLDEFADIHIAQRLSTIAGVGQVLIFGSQKYAVRLFVDPDQLAKRGIGVERVVAAIQAANSNLPAGALQGKARTYTVKSTGKLARAADFNSLIIAYHNGQPVRFSDIGRAVDSVENEKVRSWLDGDQAILLGVFRQPGSNTVEPVRRIRALLPEIERQAPPGVTVTVLNDRSEFIRDSIHEVNLTLVLAIFLVVMVILLFLRNLKSTLITALILPTSVLGTFGIMHILGYSLNNLSLMAVILAVGFVVDDAIVVLENISRHLEMGKDRMRAALEGAQEIGFTVLSMTISLAVVFLPILFMEGMLGRLFREFAVTVGVAVLTSGVVSLSLTPMLCSLLVEHTREHGRVYQALERFFNGSREVYGAILRWTMGHRGLMLAGSAVILALTFVLYAWVPKGFIPRQDMGVVFANTRAPEGVTFDELVKRQQAVAAIIQDNRNVETVMSTAGQGFGGIFGDNIGRLIVRLKPREERDVDADGVIQELRREIRRVQGLRVFLQNPPSIRLGGLSTSGDYQLVLTGTELAPLYKATEDLEARLKDFPLLQDVNTNLELRNPEIQVNVLRDRAAALGVTPQQIEATLYNAYGGRQISSIYGAADQYDVRLEFDRRFQSDINLLKSLHVQSANGSMVPIHNVAEIKSGVGPIAVQHWGLLPAATISFNLAPGASVGDAIGSVREIAREVLPIGIGSTFAGSAREFQDAFRTLPLLLAVTIIVVFMILAILYEHYGHPITILTALPLAGFGALLTLIVFGMELNIFSFVGIILLVGLVKKNGIMMVDFALQLQREKGMAPQEAIVQSCLIRFRPIMMTTMAAIFATLPIALGFGAGAEARRPLGVAVVGGLLFSQFLTLFVTPTFYVSMERVVDYLRRRKAAKTGPLRPA
ncbi:MAG: efflux RND transporter permease subunit [Betaproteobacteria bacterium]|nr:MAG: efflux RND transporter permease subunit [Betaproteobacteria bacterium]